MKGKTRAASTGPAKKTGRPGGGLPPYDPQLALLVLQPPDGDGWLHEVKLDGFRIGCAVERGRATLLSRRRHDWSAEFPALVAAAGKLEARSALLDGELAAVAPDGRTSLHAMHDGATIAYFVFDLLHLDGEDLSGQPIEQRKASARSRSWSGRTTATSVTPPTRGCAPIRRPGTSFARWRAARRRSPRISGEPERRSASVASPAKNKESIGAASAAPTTITPASPLELPRTRGQPVRPRPEGQSPIGRGAAASLAIFEARPRDLSMKGGPAGCRCR
jgi:hypothetical protein